MQADGVIGNGSWLVLVDEMISKLNRGHSMS